MAVDTENKRASVVMLALPFRDMLPIPDGTINAGDRAETAFSYRGIIDAGGTTPTPGVVDWLTIARRRGRR